MIQGGSAGSGKSGAGAVTSGSGSLRVLLVEDDAYEVVRIKNMVRHECSAIQIEFKSIDRLWKGLSLLEAGGYDAIFLSLDVPDVNGLEGLRRLQIAFPYLPVVALANPAQADVGSVAIAHGAEDYLVKGKLDGDKVVRAVRNAVERFRLRTQLRDLSLVDLLTGLYTRKTFLLFLDHHARLSGRRKSGVLVLYADIDKFGQINQKHGVKAGDQVLKDVAGALVKSLRTSDVVARVGPDEFAALLVGAGKADGPRIVTRIQKHLGEIPRNYIGGADVALNMILVWHVSQQDRSADDVLRCAAKALAARRAGS